MVQATDGASLLVTAGIDFVGDEAAWRQPVHDRLVVITARADD